MHILGRGPAHNDCARAYLQHPDSMLEMIRRGNGFRDLACRQAVDLAIQAGRGNVDLLLTPEQFAKLTGKL